MGMEIQKAPESLLHNNDKDACSVSSFRPQLYGFRCHRRYAMQKIAIFLQNRPEFFWHGQSHANIGNVGENGLQFFLPSLRSALPTTRTESRFAGVVHKLPLLRRAIHLRPQGNGPAIEDTYEALSDMGWCARVIPLLSRKA